VNEVLVLAWVGPVDEFNRVADMSGQEVVQPVEMGVNTQQDGIGDLAGCLGHDPRVQWPVSFSFF